MVTRAAGRATETATRGIPVECLASLGVRKLLGHEPNHYRSTSDSEILRCELTTGEIALLFCKHGDDCVREVPTFRAGLTYEASIYRNVLALAHVSVPRFFGMCTGPESSSLVIGYLPGTRLAKSPDPQAMTRAATWLGAFHAQFEAPNLSPTQQMLLRRHDLQYYEMWFEHAAGFLDAARRENPWVEALRRRRGEVCDLLSQEPATVVHGDCYPNNVLVGDAGVYPIDWESAALAAGQVDLAALTERWSDEVTNACTHAYCAARWDGDRPADFDRVLAAARLYLLVRLASLDTAMIETPAGVRRLRRIRSECEKVGIL